MYRGDSYIWFPGLQRGFYGPCPVMNNISYVSGFCSHSFFSSPSVCLQCLWR